MRFASIILILTCVGCDKASVAGGNAAGLPRAIPGDGVIRGAVNFVGTTKPMRTFTATEKCCQGDPPIIEQTVVVNSNGTLRNVFVYLEDAPKTDGSELAPALLDQVRCSYVPHAMGIQAGQLLRVRSSDPTMHNVHYNPEKNNSRNLSMTGAGHEVPVSFTAAEFIRMKCDVHPWMTAWVGVFDNPFFAVTSDSGAFEIKEIPSGTYKLVVWHELYGRQEQSVTIADNKPIEISFSFGARSLDKGVLVSDTIIDHGYVPEEHAPDPVTSHGDPTPPGKIAIWLFLASEIMFFIGVLGSYIVLRSGSAALFGKHAEALNKVLAGTNTLVLILSSVTMYIAVEAAHKGNRKQLMTCLFATILCGCGFMVIKYFEYTAKFTHHTIVIRESPNDPNVWVMDGHVHGHGAERTLFGYKSKLPKDKDFNINLTAERDVHEWAVKQEAARAKATNETPKEIKPQEHQIKASDIIAQDITYGPWKNIFYASYFTTTGVHGAHVVGGLIAMGILLIHAMRGKLLPAHTEYIGLYWHFVDLVWIFLFPLLYLI